MILRKILFVFIGFVYIYISSSLLLFQGPFKALRSYVIDSFAITRHAYLLRPLSLYMLTNKEIYSRSNNWIDSGTASSTKLKHGFSTGSSNNLKIYHYESSMFSAVIMLVPNARKVHVAVTRHVGVMGETVLQMTHNTNAIAGINGGAFSDTSWRGTGGAPLGTVISNNKLLMYDPESPIIGITADGQLLCGKYTLDELKADKVTDAVTYGPILVQGGNPVAPTDSSRAPRTAIGQTKDGTMIFVITDGRSIKHLGASYQDVQNLMLQYHAVTAANLDGGSSTTMVYQGKVINEVTDILGSRLVATSFVVYR